MRVKHNIISYYIVFLKAKTFELKGIELLKVPNLFGIKLV